VNPHFRKNPAPTKEGVVLIPSAFSMTLGVLPSMIATQLLVVPEKKRGPAWDGNGETTVAPPGLVNIKKAIENCHL